MGGPRNLPQLSRHILRSAIRPDSISDRPNSSRKKWLKSQHIDVHTHKELQCLNQSNTRKNEIFVETILRYIPGFRGYLEKEYRRDADALQRQWLTDRLKRALSDPSTNSLGLWPMPARSTSCQKSIGSADVSIH